MNGLAGQVHGLVADRATDLFTHGAWGPAAGAAVVACAVWRVYDKDSFRQIAAPALAAVQAGDAAAASGALPALAEFRAGTDTSGDPDLPDAVLASVADAVIAAVTLTAGVGGPEHLVGASDAVFVAVHRLAEVEAIPEVAAPDFVALMAEPTYLTAPVPVPWREAARQVRALRLASTTRDAWTSTLAEADVLGNQLGALARILHELRGPVSAAYPIVNDFDFGIGQATALRSAPPALLADPDELRSQILGWIEDVGAFVGARRIGSVPAVPRSAVRSRQLLVGVPVGSAEAHRSFFEEVAQEAATRPVPVTLRVAEVG